MRKNIGLILVFIFIVLFLYTLSAKKVVPIPDDAVHFDMTDEKLCLDCHGEGKENPLKKSHPPKYQCLKCHKMKRTK
ncbi:MAG: hypothetical protein HY758_01510 [Nitrospirae bacterium]|nr:hypothetical protein [Nitrospirota bacterium]